LTYEGKFENGELILTNRTLEEEEQAEKEE